MEGDVRLAHGIPARLTPAEGRKFAFTVGAAFLVLAGILWWREVHTVARVLGGIGIVLGLLGVVIPGSLGPVYRAWMGLALLISKVTTPIFMGLVFFVSITPIALLMRLFGKRPMKVAPGPTYWHDRPEGHRRGDLSRQF
jgi:hypothetical protein